MANMFARYVSVNNEVFDDYSFIKVHVICELLHYNKG